MAIPWLIGGAVVAAATWALSDDDTSSNSSSDRDYERRKAEREADRERKQASNKAAQQRKQSKIKELKKITEQHIDVICSDYALNDALIDKKTIAAAFVNESTSDVNDSFHGTFKFAAFFSDIEAIGNDSYEKALKGLNDAYHKSDIVVDSNDAICKKVNDIQEMKILLEQLRGL